jgi:GTP-binding protein HflX
LQTLEEIEADHIPVLTVLNKIDRLESRQSAQTLLEDFLDTVAISALTGEGKEELLAATHKKLFESFAPLDVLLPYSEGGLSALFHEQGQVEEVEHTKDGVRIVGRIPGRLLARFKEYEDAPEVEEEE